MICKMACPDGVDSTPGRVKEPVKPHNPSSNTAQNDRYIDSTTRMTVDLSRN